MDFIKWIGVFQTRFRYRERPFGRVERPSPCFSAQALAKAIETAPMRGVMFRRIIFSRQRTRQEAGFVGLENGCGGVGPAAVAVRNRKHATKKPIAQNVRRRTSFTAVPFRGEHLDRSGSGDMVAAWAMMPVRGDRVQPGYHRSEATQLVRVLHLRSSTSPPSRCGIVTERKPRHDASGKNQGIRNSPTVAIRATTVRMNASLTKVVPHHEREHRAGPFILGVFPRHIGERVHGARSAAKPSGCGR